MKLTKTTLTANGVSAKVYIYGGPWVDGVSPDLIKLRAKGNRPFPREIHQAFMVENNSDAREDFFEGDCIRLMPDHELYDVARKILG